MEELWRTMTESEITRAAALLIVVSDTLRVEAANRGRDLDAMVEESESYANVVKSVVVDIVARVLMTSTDQEPVSQASESALGYSVSATYLNPGGGIYIKTSELKRLGLLRPRYGAVEIYGLT